LVAADRAYGTLKGMKRCLKARIIYCACERTISPFTMKTERGLILPAGLRI
jgi:hypothetical protein